MVYLIIQGKLREGGKQAYSAYLDRVYPLMERYGVKAVAVGKGFESEHTHYFKPNNAILEIRDKYTLEKYLGDPEYLRIKKNIEIRLTRNFALAYLKLITSPWF